MSIHGNLNVRIKPVNDQQFNWWVAARLNRLQSVLSVCQHIL